MLQWRDSSGKTDASRPRSAARRLDRSSAESEAMEAASRFQLIAASCSAIPNLPALATLRSARLT
ncbi:hypothetical protein HUG20_15435 [Salicibibacter cibi]|uniref:Uncharacterized protein n=1 Tax=Salicibibacter cibi TaxID=2743001 RepID=A0A7T7CGH8_9BACI|nr:hypothetical protein [Salicibibacter cibi]QQK81154.1 hypothetical protein HUG20_15435 [Salicibibacter cibi]